MASTGAAQRYGCYVGNIDSSVSLEVLKQVFASCGTIVDASLNGQPDNPYRFGFIDFATEEARACALKYNGFTLVGRKLRVNVSKGNVGKPEGGGARDHGRSFNPAMQQQQQLQQPQMYGMQPVAAAPVPQPQLPAPSASGLTPAEEQQGHLLIQLIQQGTIHPDKLTDEQRKLAFAVASQGRSPAATPAAPAAAAAAPPVPAPVPVAAPMPQQPGMPPMMPPMGMYGAPMWGPYMDPYSQQMMAQQQGMYGQPQMPPQGGQRYPRPPRPSANPMPSEEVLKMRELQKEQFMKVVREDTDAYVRKHCRSAEGEARDDHGDDAHNADGADDGAGEKREKRARLDISDEDEAASERSQ